jgi:hypothetical protein
LAAVARRSAADGTQIAVRNELAKFTGDTFTQVGEELYAVAHVLGPGRNFRLSPSRHGVDQIDAISLLFRITGQLTLASANLVGNGMHYAAAALVRQIVEVEYLAWAFQSCDKDAERWLRRSFFTPGKLRSAANGEFRGKDYGYHCELGGHPVPGSIIFFPDNLEVSQLLLSDLLGHTGRIWDHFLDWSAGDEWTLPIYCRREEMFLKYDAWKKVDELTLLPPP